MWRKILTGRTLPLLLCPSKTPKPPNPLPFSLLNTSPFSTPTASNSPHHQEPHRSYHVAAMDDGDEDDELLLPNPKNPQELHPDLLRDVEAVVSSLRNLSTDTAGAKDLLDRCGAIASEALVAEALSRLRNSWAAAHAAFLWAARQPGYAHGRRAYHSMLAILGKARRFDAARNLLEEMRRSSLVTPAAVLILIRRYCAAHDVARAVDAFYMLKRFDFAPGIADFHGLLSALCRYKNVADAEHLLLCSETAFPFETKSFNIVLNGWCNAVCSVREAKRFWKDMENRGIVKDVMSYGSMISCFSKAGNLNDVLKLFNRMKEAGIVPDRKVYNAVVYALAKGRCVDDARALVRTMEEKGVAPDAATYNSLIRPLCKARQMEAAREIFEEMLEKGLSPSIRTFHALFDAVKSPEAAFQLLAEMKSTRCSPEMDTYIMLIRKFCRWRQHESVDKLWNEMPTNGLSPDRSAYIVLIHGLFLNGKLEEAAKYYEEMKAKGFSPEQKTEMMIQAWLSGKGLAEVSASSVFKGG